MAHIDAVLLNLTERCCQKFQLLTGRTNVWLAVQLTNLSVVVYFVWAGLYSWSRGIVELIIVALFCAGLMYVLTKTVLAVSIEAAEIAAYQRVARGFRNPRRLRDAPLRIAFLTLSVMLSYPVYFVYVSLRVELVLLTYSLIVLTTAVLYVLACDPLPPCVGKVRQWLRGAVPSRSVSSSVAGSRSVRRPCRRHSQRRRRSRCRWIWRWPAWQRAASVLSTTRRGAGTAADPALAAATLALSFDSVFVVGAMAIGLLVGARLADLTYRHS